MTYENNDFYNFILGCNSYNNFTDINDEDDDNNNNNSDDDDNNNDGNNNNSNDDDDRGQYG